MFRFQSIDHIARKIKTLPVLAVLMLLGIYFGGRLAWLERHKPPVTIRQAAMVMEVAESHEAPTADVLSAKGLYVASKNSTKYHLPTCTGAKKISEANKIWFSSKIEAEKAGYTPAGNCKGI